MSEEIPQLKEGIHYKIAPDVYFGQNSISRSDVLMAKWPAKLKFFKEHPEMQKSATKAEDFGNAFHCRILEPEQFPMRYAVSPYETFRTKEAQAWRDAQEAAKITVLTKGQAEMLDLMVQNAREHPQFNTVFGRSGTKKELTFIARDPGTGLLLRARYDLLPPGNVIPDLKSTIDASPDGFGKQVWNLEYGMQAAFYLKVHNLLLPNEPREEFVFFAFEKEPPYLSAFYVVPQMLIEYCSKIVRARLYTIASCIKTNKWPGYPEQIEEFELPPWAVKEIEKSEENG